jgi:hypothetical protein
MNDQLRYSLCVCFVRSVCEREMQRIYGCWVCKSALQQYYAAPIAAAAAAAAA